MTVVFQFLIAVALIAAMILIRVIANRYQLRQKLNCSHVGGDCDETDCSAGSEEKRSACHAP